MHKESCDICREGFLIATSSIAKNFVISGKEQVEMFINAIEESAKTVQPGRMGTPGSGK